MATLFTPLYADFKAIVQGLSSAVSGQGVVFWDLGTSNSFGAVFVSGSIQVILQRGSQVGQPATFAADFPGAIELQGGIAIATQGGG